MIQFNPLLEAGQLQSLISFLTTSPSQVSKLPKNGDSNFSAITVQFWRLLIVASAFFFS